MSNKSKCPIFGCTISGIPHEHPAGVSAMMRDPAEPLNNEERAELERYRAAAEKDMDEDTRQLRKALLNQSRGMQHIGPGSMIYDRAMGTNYYVVPADAPMVPGRKLRDALTEAGNGIHERYFGEQFTQEEMSEAQSKNPYSFNKILPHAHPRSFVRTVGMQNIGPGSEIYARAIGTTDSMIQSQKLKDQMLAIEIKYAQDKSAYELKNKIQQVSMQTYIAGLNSSFSELFSELKMKNASADSAPKPRRSFIRLVGRIAAWIVVWTALFAFAGFALHSRFAELAGWWS